MPSLVGEVEAEKVSRNLIRDARSPNEIGIIEGSMVDWKDVQALLSNMGIQLIHDTSKTKSVEKIINAKKKRGDTELQSLKFNVNYDRNSCSRGKKIFP